MFVKNIKMLTYGIMGRLNLPSHFWPFAIEGAAHLLNIQVASPKRKSAYNREFSKCPRYSLLPGDPVVFRDEKDNVMVGAFMNRFHSGGFRVLRCDPVDWDSVVSFVLHPKMIHRIPLHHKETGLTWDAMRLKPPTTIEVGPDKASVEVTASLSTLKLPAATHSSTAKGTTRNPQSEGLRTESSMFLIDELDPDQVLKGWELTKGNHQSEAGLWIEPKGLRKSASKPIEVKGDIVLLGKNSEASNAWYILLDFTAMSANRSLNALKEEDVITRPGTSREVALGQWDEPDTIAIKKLIDDGVIGRTMIPRSQLDFCCNIVIVRNWHLKADGVTVVGQKSRAAADGRNDPRDVSGHITLPDMPVHRACMIYGLGIGKILTSDVTAAYPHASLDEKYRVGVVMPRRLPKGIQDLGFVPGRIYPVLKNYYGLRDAGKRFAEFVDNVAFGMDFERVSPGVYMRGLELWCAYVDDNLTVSPRVEELQKELQKHLKLEDGKLFRVGDEMKYVGGGYKRISEEVISCSLSEYISAQQIDGTPRDLPLFLEKVKNWNEESEEYPFVVNESYLPEVRKLCGIINWVARHHMTAALLASLLSRHMGKPSAELVRACRAGLIHLRDSPEMELRTLRPGAPVEIRLISDASWSSRKEAQGGGIVQVIEKDAPDSST